MIWFFKDFFQNLSKYFVSKNKFPSKSGNGSLKLMRRAFNPVQKADQKEEFVEETKKKHRFLKNQDYSVENLSDLLILSGSIMKLKK
jgi:hypothetical protein